MSMLLRVDGVDVIEFHWMEPLYWSKDGTFKIIY